MLKELSAPQISSLCMELHLILKAGISISEGFYILANDEQDPEIKAFLDEIHSLTDGGMEFHKALRHAGGFPSYALNMIEASELTGKLEPTLRELSVYYTGREELAQTIKGAVIYPAVLLVMVLFVVVILISRVLPIFNDVFNQLGSTITGFAAFTMNLGGWINRNAVIVIVLVCVLIAIAAVVALVPGLRKKFAVMQARRKRGGKLAKKMAYERFASAMSMAVSSGLDNDTALEMADKMADNPLMSEKIKVCKQNISEGAGFARAINAAGIFPPLYCRMLEIGIKTGSMDTVMAEIARRSSDEIENEIQSIVRKVEPTIVIVMSAIVGIILLSVMLPLMGIMSSII